MKTVQEVSRIIRAQKGHGQKVSFVMGVFDVLHTGHLRYFQFAKAHSDFLVVATPSDQAIKLTKGNGRPINKLQDRVFFLEKLKDVDCVLPVDIPFNLRSAEANKIEDELYKKLSPDFVVVFAEEIKSLSAKRKRLEQFGIKMLVDKARKENSTSAIVEKMKQS